MLPLNLIDAHFCDIEGPLPLGDHHDPSAPDASAAPGRFRRWLLDDAAPLAIRDQVWADLIRRVRDTDEAEPLHLLLLGLAVPGLRRAAGRAKLQSPGTERADLEAEAITGFIAAISTVDLARRAICSQLCQAAHTAARSLGRSNRRQRHESEEALLREEPERVGTGHVDLILGSAVTAGVIDRAEAHLIGATRFDGEHLTAIARRTGRTPLAVGLCRRRAEERLCVWLKALRLTGLYTSPNPVSEAPGAALVSTLSETIADLRAAIEESERTQATVRAIRDVVEQLATQLRMDTDGSTNPLVEEGLGQLAQSQEKLEEALALYAAGDDTIERYIEGTLLGGGSTGGAGAGGHGGKPPSPPPPAPPQPSGPEPVPKLVHDLAERLPPGGKGKTTVVFAYDDNENGDAVRFESGRDRSAAEGLKTAYKRLIIMDHAEAKLAAAIRDSRPAAGPVVAVINNQPCGGLRGCDAVFPDLIPTGAKVMIYVKCESGTQLYGTYDGNGKAIA
ncbi:DddA-like double-stranded DNA deaminase toxin [Glycomyces buryatensis]|nr:DddA-like double-stranded DNA deaminase toxin [Glycomyces buryatensis]